MPPDFSLRRLFLLILFVALSGAMANDKPYAIVPGLKVSPEVGIGLGLVAFHSALPDTGSRFDLKALVTTHSQVEVKLLHRKTRFLGTGWELHGETAILRFPDSYFGSGNNPADSDETDYTPEGGDLSFELLHSLPGSFRFLLAGKGEGYTIQNVHKLDGGSSVDSIFNRNVMGRKGGYSDLWETGIEYDTRDNQDVPREGVYAGQRIGSSLTGDFRFQSFETWFNGYLPLGEHWETAGRLWQKTLTGDPPFFDEPYLGDENFLRGVNHKRFRDRSAQLVQTELRFGFPLALPFIDSWLGHEWQIAVFAEAGRVGNGFVSASEGTVHFSGGMGGRLLIGKRLGAVRGDLGFSQYGFALIIDFDQAF